MSGDAEFECYLNRDWERATSMLLAPKRFFYINKWETWGKENTLLSSYKGSLGTQYHLSVYTACTFKGYRPAFPLQEPFIECLPCRKQRECRKTSNEQCHLQMKLPRAEGNCSSFNVTHTTVFVTFPFTQICQLFKIIKEIVFLPFLSSIIPYSNFLRLSKRQAFS